MGKQESTQKYNRRELFFISGTNYLHTCDTVIKVCCHGAGTLGKGGGGFLFCFSVKGLVITGCCRFWGD